MGNTKHKDHDHSQMEHGRHETVAAPEKDMRAGHAHHEMMAKSSHDMHAGHVDHTGHEDLFRRRFWVSLLLSIPVLLYTPMLQMWLGFRMPDFFGSQWIMPLFSVIVFLYGGVPFLQMAVPEVRQRQPGMMTLISLAISVSFVYSLAALFVNLGRRLFLGVGHTN